MPPALLDEPWLAGRKIVMLEPRRLAARNCASFIAQKLGEPVGATEAASGTGKIAAANTSFMGTADDYDMAQIRVL